VLTSAKIAKFVNAMEKIMKHNKPVDTGIVIDELIAPWKNETFWVTLEPQERWKLRKEFYVQQRGQETG
jgi:hypothetical protein